MEKIINVTEDYFAKIEDVLIGLQTQQLSPKNKNALDIFSRSEGNSVLDIIKRRISDLEIKMQ